LEKKVLDRALMCSKKQRKKIGDGCASTEVSIIRTTIANSFTVRCSTRLFFTATTTTTNELINKVFERK